VGCERTLEPFDVFAVAQTWASPPSATWRRHTWQGGALPFIDDLPPIDNSSTGRVFQNVAKLRLNVLLAGGTEGAQRARVLLGIGIVAQPSRSGFPARGSPLR
jgi:hypothetical protein